MGEDIFSSTINIIKILVIFLIMVQSVPILVWLERRASAFMQNRFGPNRVGPLGLLQLLADFVKVIFKEDFVNPKAHKAYFYAAPIIAVIPAALAFGALPLSAPVYVDQFQFFGQTLGPYIFEMRSFPIEIGIVFVFGVSSLAVYSLLLAGWSSGNKYSLLGGLRASAQAISYELALSLSLIGIIIIFNTFSFDEIIELQNRVLKFQFFSREIQVGFLPNWGIFYQPLGALLLFIALFAEANRLPFDLPEAESELVAGYHTEYGGLKIIIFYIAEYGHMLVASSLMVILYFGGYNFYPLFNEDILQQWLLPHFSITSVSLLTSLILFICFFVKVAFFLWFFIWVRWTLPRFRYDQLMDLGWKTLLPWSLVNAIGTAFFVWAA